jgi:hypothetical protein
MCQKYDPIGHGVLDARVWLLIVGHGEIAIETLDTALRVRLFTAGANRVFKPRP